MMHLLSYLSNEEKHTIDIVVAGTSVGAWLTNSLPTVLVFMTLVWTIIRIYETDTVQRLLGKKEDGKDSDSN